jgi:anti-sigma factor RsiW
MTCQELVELVTDYFDGALDEAARDRFEAHLDGCPDCEHYVEQMRVTLRLARDVESLQCRPEVISLLSAFRHWHPADPTAD